MSSRLVELLRHPWCSALMGLLLIATGLGEVLEPFMDDIQGNEAQFGAHHGVTLFGLYTLLQSVGSLLSGVKDMREGAETMRHRAPADGVPVGQRE